MLLLCQERLLFERGVDSARELSFEAAECFAPALPLALLALEVGTRGRVDTALGNRDPVQGAVELAVAAAVEPVAPVFAGAGFERCDAGVAGELRVGVEAFDRSDLAEQLGGADRAAAGQCQERRRGLRGRCLQLAVEFEDRPREAAAASDELARDPDLRCLLQAGEPASKPIESDGAVERPERDLKRRLEIVQVPAQPLGCTAAWGV